MPSSVFFNEHGQIEITSKNEVASVNSVAELGEEFTNLSTLLEDKGEKIKILINSTNVKEWDQSAFKFIVIMFKGANFSKLATYGANDNIAKLQLQAITQAGILNRSKICQTRAEAITWLESG